MRTELLETDRTRHKFTFRAQIVTTKQSIATPSRTPVGSKSTVMLLAFVVSAVLLGAAQPKAEHLSPTRLRAAKETKIDPNNATTSFVSRTLLECNLGEGIVECETTSRSCANYEIKGCSVFCMDGYACEGARIEDSSVECSEYNSCDNAKIYRSFVYCAKGSSCFRAEFHANVISCGDVFQSCAFADYDLCSCCDGDGCQNGISKCTVNGAPSEEFCSSQSVGITCAALGNPMCVGMPGYENPTSSQETEGASTSAPQETNGTSPQETEGTSTGASPQETDGTPTTSGQDPSTDKAAPPLEIIIPVVVAVVGAFGAIVTALIKRRQIIEIRQGGGSETKFAGSTE